MHERERTSTQPSTVPRKLILAWYDNYTLSKLWGEHAKHRLPRRETSV